MPRRLVRVITESEIEDTARLIDPYPFSIGYQKGIDKIMTLAEHFLRRLDEAELMIVPREEYND